MNPGGPCLGVLVVVYLLVCTCVAQITCKVCMWANQFNKNHVFCLCISIYLHAYIHSFCPHGSGPGVVSVSRIMIWKRRKREEKGMKEGFLPGS